MEYPVHEFTNDTVPLSRDGIGDSVFGLRCESNGVIEADALRYLTNEVDAKAFVAFVTAQVTHGAVRLQYVRHFLRIDKCLQQAILYKVISSLVTL